MAAHFITTAFKKDGKFTVRNREKFESWWKRCRDGEFSVTFERMHATRSPLQNSLYHVAYVKPLSEYTGYTHKEMHEYLKKRFYPAHKRKVKVMLLHNRQGEVIDEYEVDMSSTTVLDKLEFSDFLRDIGVFAAELGVDVGTNRSEAA